MNNPDIVEKLPGGIKQRLGWLAPVLLMAVFLFCLFGWSMQRDLNHDEHQFLAPGALLANDGLLPFRDYPIFHLPNLTFVYAALDSVTGRPIFSAKLLSAASSWFAGLFLVITAYRFPPFRQQRCAFPGACFALGFLFFDPVFTYTSGKTWNHEFATCLAIAATILVAENNTRVSLKLAALAGLCAGGAVATRLTFAPLMIPLGLAHLLYQTTPRRRALLAFSFTSGVLIALAPSLLLYRSAPEAFLFDNFQFPKLRLLDPANERIQKTASLWRKLRYFLKEIAVPSWPLFAAFLFLVIRPVLQAIRQREKRNFACILVFITIPFVVAGCFAPSRYQYQHYFALIPFLVLGALCGAAMPACERTIKLSRIIIPALLIAAAGGYAIRQSRKDGAGFAWIANTFRPSEWFPIRMHAMSAELSSLIGPGKVLTLAPAWVTEAGLKIYPEFANGPFAWRAAHLVEEKQRNRLKLIAPSDLETFLASDPPAAVLLKVEDDDLEIPLRNYALLHGYQRCKTKRKWELWVPAKH